MDAEEVIRDGVQPPVEPWQIAVGVRLLTPSEHRQRQAYFDRKTRLEISPQQWQRAIGHRLLTPFEQEARNAYFQHKAQEALLAGEGRRPGREVS